MSLCGEIDIASAQRAYHTVAAVLGADCTVVDLSAVDFVDASAVGTFIRLLKEATLSGHHLLFAAPTPNVGRVFTALRLGETLDIHGDVAAAAAAHPLRRVSSPTGPQQPPTWR